MRRSWSLMLLLTHLVAGCYGKEPHQAETKRLAEDFRPQSVAFWDGQRGVIAGREGCFDQCGDSLVAITSDGGATWQVVHDNGLPVSALAVAEGRIWASFSCENEPPGCQPPLMRSTDGGRTWKKVSEGILAPSFADPEHGWALPGPGYKSWDPDALPVIMTTADGGETWQTIPSPCPKARLGTAAVHPVSRTEGWAACVGQPGAGQQEKTLHRTTDGGQTWQEAGNMGGGGYLSGIFFRPGGKGWSWHSRGTTLATADSGKTWTWLETFQPETTEARDVWLVSDTTGYVIQHDNNERYFKLLVTMDGGKSFKVRSKWPIDPS